MRTPAILRNARNAMNHRISDLHNRYTILQGRYCQRNGGHDWTEWQQDIRETVAGGYIETRHRWCMRCSLTQSEDIP